MLKTSLSLALLICALTVTPALASPPSGGASQVDGTPVLVSEDGSLGSWQLSALNLLDGLYQYNPGLSDLRFAQTPRGNVVGPGETVTLRYSGMDGCYLNVVRYGPDGAATLLLNNVRFDKRSSRAWLMDATAGSMEGNEVFLSLTTREPLIPGTLEKLALAPNTVRTFPEIVGSSYVGFKVLNQTGLRIEGDGITQANNYNNNGGGGGYNGQYDQYPRQQESRGSSYNDRIQQQYPGAITVTEGNPYYTPPMRGAYRYNPFLSRYGCMPFYANGLFIVPGAGGFAGPYRPVYDYGNAFYSPNTTFFILPTIRGVRTNFSDLAFSADFSRDGITFRGGNDFIEGALGIDLGSRGNGLTLRLRGVRDEFGRPFDVTPVVIVIDGNPVQPLVDTNTGDWIVNLPRQDPQGLGGRIRIAPANINGGPIHVDGIEVGE
ncbi:MAG: hypothetical protein ABI743_14170 [bacterium]